MDRQRCVARVCRQGWRGVGGIAILELFVSLIDSIFLLWAGLFGRQDNLSTEEKIEGQGLATVVTMLFFLLIAFLILFYMFFDVIWFVLDLIMGTA